ncbi:hypothetical protein PCANC_01353 [Puccinia coronata f. sp. avenae]|uniref:Uncharacterized protein n=1 Tax=Puccinia coronata f. sp. avenae TaxID=200324 RepID=A0A2N5W627_9BASI|nr:hypothetical protein PCASD_11010 [Puccinia coronata f. sp. avenae]PLW50906.1 hypothetical protein PCASD_01162 [Puccinia coronata f. sp. avenae]PLW57694.1 hypothetical protein PCANC_01353 [Puccinia coronata f. sp. avenae]
MSRRVNSYRIGVHQNYLTTISLSFCQRMVARGYSSDQPGHEPSVSNLCQAKREHLSITQVPSSIPTSARPHRFADRTVGLVSWREILAQDFPISSSHQTFFKLLTQTPEPNEITHEIGDLRDSTASPLTPAKSISNGRGVDRPGFGGLQADVPKCHRCVTLVQFMDCRLMAGVDLWRAKLPKVAAEGGIGPPPPSLAASVAAPLEDNYTLRAAKVRSRSRDGSSVGDALRIDSLKR